MRKEQSNIDRAVNNLHVGGVVREIMVIVGRSWLIYAGDIVNYDSFMWYPGTRYM